ncbi:putative Phytochrome-like protein cph2 [Petrocella atlantisensis]|uniref:Putative Phytochrome-like protein cph2 n=1 Tax=Petrocella atlantisensis TaxID=2173034 RepID=A0A3P7RXN9_9FIRM|nr:EAL domain-containing protein [Petrocella atlantisensis]VDN47496.1 putative Phytochrome-like protein cph2 [Petrocella atlantisensis]
MILKSEYFSIGYFLVALIHLFIGIYILNKNKKHHLNKILFFVTLSLAIWSFGFSMENSATSLEKALAWRRVMAVGWGSFFALLVHYIILLTGKENILFNQTRKLLFYSPSIFLILTFSLIPNIAKAQYNLSWTKLGWMNAATGGLMDVIFNLYVVVFSAVALILLIVWRDKKRSREVRKTKVIIVATLTLAVVFGVISDLVLYRSIGLEIPQLGVFFAVIPIIGTVYSINIHGLMIARQHRSYQDDYFLNEKKHQMIFAYTSALIIIIGIVNIGVYFVSAYTLEDVLGVSGLICLAGILVMFISIYVSRLETQDKLYFFINTGLVTYLLIHYSGRLANNFIWALPVLFLLISILFNYKRFIYAISLTSLIYHAHDWAFNQGQIIDITYMDWTLQISFYILIFLSVLLVNNYLNDKLLLNQRYIINHQNLAQLSSDFITIDKNTIEKKTLELLDVANKLLDASCGHAIKYPREGQSFGESIQTSNQCHVEYTTLDTIKYGLGELSDSFFNGEIIQIFDLENHVQQNDNFRCIVDNNRARSMILIPVTRGNDNQGHLMFLSGKRKQWGNEEEESLIILRNILSDAWDKIDSQNNINELAYSDLLTGLSNRKMFQIHMDEILRISKRSNLQLGIMFLDLDDFKYINDTLGHDAGDELLRIIGNRIKENLRLQDIACRFGGDEFLVIIPGVASINELQSIVENIMSTFEVDVNIKNHMLKVAASAGIAVYPEDGNASETLVKHADMAMYKAKALGKNKYVFCNDSMKRETGERTKLLKDLHYALVNDELFLMFQPQVNCDKNLISGFEALVRWQHPQKGMISPGVFIPLAEQSGLIHEIGEWVLINACKQSYTWRKEGFDQHIMAVNLSVEQLKDERIIDKVTRIIGTYHMDPKYLELEVTESVAIHEEDDVIQRLAQFREMGISIAIDDFGTEYSSLSRLKRLPIDRLKLAMEFVRNVDQSEKDQAVAKVIIDLAKNMKFRLIAEGVERKEELDFLMSNGCSEFQGYYFYRPMRVDEINSFEGQEVRL